MFGLSLIKTEELAELRKIHAMWHKAESNSWWPHQDFVCRLLRRVILGEHDMWGIRDEFNQKLDEFVQKKVEEKLREYKDEQTRSRPCVPGDGQA